MFDWFRKLLRRRVDAQLSKAEEQDVEVSIREIDEGKSKRFINADAMIADLKDEEPQTQHKRAVTSTVSKTELRIPLMDFRTELRNRTIAEKNQERQKATMGYGLKSRYFRPRPAHERQTWDFRKKPSDED